MTDQPDPTPGVSGIAVDSQRPPITTIEPVDPVREAVRAMLAGHANESVTGNWRWATFSGAWIVDLDGQATIKLNQTHRKDISMSLPATVKSVALLRTVLIALEAIDDV